jgi:thioredoxin-like negative regulator of GroEL
MDIEDLYQKAFKMRCDGDYTGAKPLLQQIIQVNPVHVNARHQLALIIGFEGDFDASLAALESLAKEVPSNLDVRFDFAMTQMMLGMYEEACAHMKFILSVDPNHAKAKQQIIYC